MLDDTIFDWLELYYKTKVGRNGNIKVVRLVDEDKIIKKIDNDPGISARVLTNSVLQVWNNGGLDLSIKKVFDRIQPVLCNILAGGNGGVN